MGTDNSGQINYEELKAVLEQVGARSTEGDLANMPWIQDSVWDFQ